MDEKLQRRVQRYGWDKAASSYERYWQAQIEPAQRRLLEMAAIQPGEHVLDAACGTGLVTFPAAEAAGPAGAVLATDISEGMIAAVEAEAARRGVATVTAARMGAEALDVPDASFDVVLCALGLMYVPDVAAALREFHRALRPAGRVAAVVWGARNRCGWADIFPIVDARVRSEVCPLFFNLGTGDRLADTLAQAGFTGVVSERLTSSLQYASGEDACGAAFEGGPVALAHSRFDPATRAEAHAEYLASIERWRHDGGYSIPGEFVVAVGRR